MLGLACHEESMSRRSTAGPSSSFSLSFFSFIFGWPVKTLTNSQPKKEKKEKEKRDELLSL